jgi:transcriptional regulator with XRE-family HTH domain
MSNAQRIDADGFRFAFDLGDRLDKAMRVSELSIDDMAEALDVSRNTIGNYRSGRTKPSKLQIKEWAMRTGAPIEWLMHGVEPENAPTPEGEGANVRPKA